MDFSELKKVATALIEARNKYNLNEWEEFLELAQPEVVLVLIAENEALRKDAERYRWLRREGRKHVVDAAPTILNRETGMITIMRAALADEQIDSLMAEDHD